VPGESVILPGGVRRSQALGEFFTNLANDASALFYLAALLGCIYALFAFWAVRSFARSKPAPPLASFPPVTILKPLYGAEPDLHAHLASFCRQDYPAPVQILFGVADAADPAVAVVRDLIAEFPDRNLTLVISSRRHGANAKVSNLVNMHSEARHEILVISDSDIVVPRDHLKVVVAALAEPGVGLVTCLYRGAAARGVWSRLAAAAIDYHFLPNVLVGLKLGLATPCFGSTIAVTKTTLARFGGLQSVADQLADDHALGSSVRQAGLKVVIPPLIVTHVCAERSLRDLLLHEIRWARTIRSVNSFGFTGLIITHALPLALLGMALGGLTPAALLVPATLVCRYALAAELRRHFSLRDYFFWLGPIRDLFSFVVFVASFFGRRLEWRGHRYGLAADKTLAYYGEGET
jgi:ceramide glucosyltransferase